MTKGNSNSRSINTYPTLTAPFKGGVARCIQLTIVMALALSCFACGVTTPSTSSKGGAGLLANTGFSPAEYSGWKKVSSGEAQKAAHMLNSSRQGLSSWQDLGDALRSSQKYASRKPQGQIAVSGGELTATWGEVNKSLKKMLELLPRLDSNPSLLASSFAWYRIGPDISFTGYYEPTIKASRVKTKQFSHPLYRLPPDVRKGKRYHNRYAIDECNVLSGRGLEIAWIESKVDSFFLQIQGSGRLEFTDGTVKHVLYAGKNNCEYKALGRVMKEKGLLSPDNVNMKAIRAYLEAHPSEVSSLLCENPSYVFFRLADKGPVGAMSAVLTPKVSLATDSTLPMGSLLFYSVPMPGDDGKQGGAGYMAGIGLPQDKGGAIKGGRADLFCGAGAWAEHTAGFLDAKGAVFMLLPK